MSRGYQDSGADLAYNLHAQGEDVAFPVDTPRPEIDAEWSFPDTIAGVRKAVEEKGASVLWANTTLHSRHALVELRYELAKRQVRLVGQNPLDTERFEDKEWINRWLATQPGLSGSFPASALLKAHSRLADLPIQLPLVLKPVRGRGSHGVTLVRTEAEYQETLSKLLKESDAVLCEVGHQMHGTEWTAYHATAISARAGSHRYCNASRRLRGESTYQRDR